MAESKQCVVFAVHRKRDPGGDFESWYGFDSLFSPVEQLDGCYDSSEDSSEDEFMSERSPYVGYKLKDESRIAKPLVTFNDYRRFSSFGCWKHSLFRVGGQYYTDKKSERHKLYLWGSKYTNRVDYWSLEEAGRWKLHSRMLQARAAPHVLVLGQSMYVVGGACLSSPNVNDKEKKEEIIFMEEFEFESEKRVWVAVANPPADSHLMDMKGMVCAAWPEGGKLLFGSKGCSHFYAYKPASSSWECCDHLRFDSKVLESSTSQYHPGIVVGNHFLWVNWLCGRSHLIGLDLIKGRYFSINLHSEGLLPKPHKLLNIRAPRLLLSGDGKLYLVCEDTTMYYVQEEGSSSEEDEEDEEASSSCGGDDDSEEEEEEEEGGGEEDIVFSNCVKEATSSKNKRDAYGDNVYGGYLCTEFVIVFKRAHKKGSVIKARNRERARMKKGYNYETRVKATGCLTITSRRKLIAPSIVHRLEFACLVNVVVAKSTPGDPVMPDSSEACSSAEVVASDSKHQGTSVVLRPCEKRRIEVVASDGKHQGSGVVLRPCKKMRKA